MALIIPTELASKHGLLPCWMPFVALCSVETLFLLLYTSIGIFYLLPY